MKRNHKQFVVVLLVALFVFVLGSCAKFEGTQTTVQIGSDTYDAYVFDDLDQLKASLHYIENDLYGDLRLGSFDEEFDSEKQTKLSWDVNSVFSKPDYNSVRKNVVVIKKVIRHTVGSTNYGYYTQIRYTESGGIRIYVWNPDQGLYSDPWDFDFGCSVD